MYIPVQQPSPSAQAMDLGQRIASVVRAYLADNPGIGSSDVAQAFGVARQLLRSELGASTSRTVFILLAGLVALGVAGVAAFLSTAGELDAQVPSIAIAAAVLAVIAVAAMLVRQSR